MRDYQQTLDFLFNSFPMFQNIGAGAYKPGLEHIAQFLDRLGNPHHQYTVIHVAGTNGKGSTAHTLAAILQSAGYRTGLFTSPHLVDFRERIRVDGKMIPQGYVVDFVERNAGISTPDGWRPSFFEFTTAMAFEYFAESKIDVAVIETGLGGRLDATNVVSPILSVITNISFDHVNLLGDTLEKIAVEKAGIIKPGVPVVIGESAMYPGVRKVFAEKTDLCGSAVVYADDAPRYAGVETVADHLVYRSTAYGDIAAQLSGECQKKNTATILCAVDELCKAGMHITSSDVANGFAHVSELTGLAGRWMQTECNGVKIICDTGHNSGGWQYLSETLEQIPGLTLVLGFVNDKDVSAIMTLLPRHARYIFTQASVRRALPAVELAALAREAGIEGREVDNVAEAVSLAVSESLQGDTVFVGGSTFVVADYLASENKC